MADPVDSIFPAEPRLNYPSPVAQVIHRSQEKLRNLTLVDFRATLETFDKMNVTVDSQVGLGKLIEVAMKEKEKGRYFK